MIDITKLLSGDAQLDSIRYSKYCSKSKAGVRKGIGPVIAWNITKKCNYACKHCYSDSNYGEDVNELRFDEITEIVNNFKQNNVPVILLSGGEPLIREDIFDIIQHITNQKIRTSLSTNGSLIDSNTAKSLKKLGISYVGISLDGMKDKNDEFRGVVGAFNDSIKAIENCHNVGQKVGLRFTLQKNNYKDIPDVLKLMEEMKVNRICFYHLVPSGRGREIANQMLSHDEIKEVIDYLYEYSKKSVRNNQNNEILTVANHADGPYLYLKVKNEDPVLAEKMYTMLKRNHGNRSGIAIANVDWTGTVYPDQFSKYLPLGNLRKASFSTIWNNKKGVLNELRDRKKHIKGKCSRCTWWDICNGNLRARAYNVLGDKWASDPSCYLEEGEL